jgi:ParB-like chromosome segregation protein Spo0J
LSPNIANASLEAAVSIDTLVPHPENPRQGNVQAIASSIEEHGFYGTVVAQVSTRRILAGNHRIESARALGLGKVDVAWLDIDDDQARRILLADNRVGDLGVYDQAQLAELLKTLSEESDLVGTGYDLDHLDDLLADLSTGFSLAARPVEIESLHPHPRNYRTHPDDQVEHLAESIAAHGFLRSVVVARDGTILAGHGLVLAARKLGRTTVPTVRVDLDPDDPQALAILVADNEIGRLAEVTDRSLTEILRDLASEGNLLGTGFNEEQLATLAMVTRSAAEIGDLNDAGEWLGMPGFDAVGSAPQVALSFKTLEDRDRCMEVLGITNIYRRTAGTWSAWWPNREMDDLSAIRYEVTEDD